MSGKLQCGFTLVEAIVSMLIIAVAALAMTAALSGAFSSSSDSLLYTKTIQLAQAYTEEIQGRRYDENTPLGGLPPCSSGGPACGAIGAEGESRADFDDVDDYDGLSETPPRNSLDQPMTEFAGFRVDVSVAYANAAQVAAWSLDAATDAKIITVTVTTPDGQARVFPVVRGNF